MIPFKVDPGWYERYWYGDHPSKAGESVFGRVRRLAVRGVQAVGATPRPGDFRLRPSRLVEHQGGN